MHRGKDPRFITFQVFQKTFINVYKNRVNTKKSHISDFFYKVPALKLGFASHKYK